MDQHLISFLLKELNTTHLYSSYTYCSGFNGKYMFHSNAINRYKVLSFRHTVELGWVLGLSHACTILKFCKRVKRWVVIWAHLSHLSVPHGWEFESQRRNIVGAHLGLFFPLWYSRRTIRVFLRVVRPFWGLR